MPLAARRREHRRVGRSAKLPEEPIKRTAEVAIILINGQNVVGDLDGEGSAAPHGLDDRSPPDAAIALVDEHCVAARAGDEERKLEDKGVGDSRPLRWGWYPFAAISCVSDHGFW